MNALELAARLTPSASNIERVSKLTSPEAARSAFLQWELRRRAQEKFADAERMFFSREALEQSSGEIAANYHASLFSSGARVTDLTVGIGGDLIALARRGPAQGFELDPERAELARANLKALGLEASIENVDGVTWMERQTGEQILCDPARRIEGRRVATPEQYQPDPSKIAKLGERQRLCVLKLSPLLNDSYLASLASKLEFVSIEGECKEVLAFCGTDVNPGRVAIHVLSRQKLPESQTPPSVESAAEFLHECDPAAIRAHAYGHLCNEFHLSPLGDSNGYLTGATAAASPWIKNYRVLHEGPGDQKSTKRKLVELGSATPVLKQRLTNLDLERLRSGLKLDGKRPLAVICYPVGRSVRHVIAEPCP